jgi:uncharacterized membrane protein YgcG
MLARSAELAAARRTAVHEDGALDDVSTLVPPVRGIRFAKPLPADATGGFEVGPPDGMRAHSRELCPQQWADAGDVLRRATLVPGVPLPEDSLSAMGAAAVALQLALEHGMRHPGFYNRLGADGDGDRAFYQGDVGSEKINLSNLARLTRRVWRATLRTTDARSEKFATPREAMAALDLLARLMVADHLHAQLHNGMAIVKMILEPHWYVASLVVIKVTLKMSSCQPSKEGQGYRLKKKMLRLCNRAYQHVLVRRMHTQPPPAWFTLPPSWGAAHTRLAAWVDATRRTAAGDALDEAHYEAVHTEMVEASNADGELKVLNHLYLDLCVPLSLEQRARAHGFGELQLLLRKFWLAPLQQSGERGAFHVMHSLCRQIFGYTGRSARRNMLALINASPSLTGVFGKSTELDALQELYVLYVKVYMVDPKSKHLLNILNTVAANLDIPLNVVPFLQRVWGRKIDRTERRWRRSSHSGSEKLVVRELARLMLRCYLPIDRFRHAHSGELGEYGRMVTSRTLTVRPAPPELLALRIFHYVTPGGGPLRISDVDALSDALSGLVDAGVLQSLKPFSELIGVVFSPLKRRDGELRADATSGEILGYARVPHGEPTPVRFTSTFLRESVTPDLLEGLQLLPVEGSTAMRCSWLGAASLNPALKFARDALPDGSLVVTALRVPLPADGDEDAGERKALLAAALRQLDAVLIALPLSLQDVLSAAQAAAPLVHLSGLPGPRLPGGGFAPTPARLKVPVAERANVFGATLPGPACRGEAQDLTLYVYHNNAKAATPDAGGGRSMKESKQRGIERQYSWLAAQARTTSTAADADAVDAEGREASDLLSLNRATLMVDEKVPTLPKPLGPHPRDGGKATAAQWGEYRSALPRRLGTTDASFAGGDNGELNAVKSWFRKQAREHEAVRAASEELWKLHQLGEAFDPSHLVATGGDGGSGGGGSGGGSGGAGGSGGGGSGGGGDAGRRSERDVLGERIEALVAQRLELEQRMWGSMSDHDGYRDLAGRRAKVIAKIVALRVSMRRLASAGAGPSSACVEAGSDSESEDGGAPWPEYLADEEEASDEEDVDFGSEDDESSDEFDDGLVSESEYASGSESEG